MCTWVKPYVRIVGEAHHPDLGPRFQDLVIEPSFRQKLRSPLGDSVWIRVQLHSGRVYVSIRAVLCRLAVVALEMRSVLNLPLFTVVQEIRIFWVASE